MTAAKKNRKLTERLIMLIKTNAMYQLIRKTKQLAKLLKEYKAAQIYEKCLYDIAQQSGRKGMFFLIEIKTGQIIKDGTPANLRGWLNMRKTPVHKVFKYSLIK